MFSESSTGTEIPFNLETVNSSSQENQNIIQLPSTSLDHHHKELQEEQIDQRNVELINLSKDDEMDNSQSQIQQVVPADSSYEKENKISESNQGDSFSKAFTLPVEYLPKKKKTKIQASGKPKLPSAGTSDEWLHYHLEKEQKQKIKEEKMKKKKKLREQKKKIAEEKKFLQEKMKEIQKRIKQETQ